MKDYQKDNFKPNRVPIRNQIIGSYSIFNIMHKYYKIFYVSILNYCVKIKYKTEILYCYMLYNYTYYMCIRYDKSCRS